MSEYTPTPDEVRDRYADARAGIGEWTRFDESVRRAVEEAYEEFDRMIAAIEREAAARALIEAAESFEATTHAWGKLAMIEHLRALAEKEGARNG